MRVYSLLTDKITTYLRGASGYFLSPFSGNTTLTTNGTMWC